MLSPGSLGAYMRAAGAVCAAVDAVLSGEARNAFCALRPSGEGQGRFPTASIRGSLGSRLPGRGRWGQRIP